MPNQLLGERAPAAADLQHALAAAQLEQRRGAIELGLLRPLERVAVVVKRRRIIHRLVEPGAEEIVAEIVVRRDIALAAAPRVVAQPVRQSIAHEAEPADGRRRGQSGFVLHVEFQQLAELGRRPVAVEITVGKAVIAVEQHAAQTAPAMRRHDRIRPRKSAVAFDDFTVRQVRCNRPAGIAGIARSMMRQSIPRRLPVASRGSVENDGPADVTAASLRYSRRLPARRAAGAAAAASAL